MSKSLKQQTVSGLFWSIADKTVEQASRFIIGIILARLLLPADFGIIGMVTVFMVVSQSFIDSGFGQALIQNRDAKQRDFSTAFYFNIAIALIMYSLIYLSADFIATFMKNELVGPVLRVISIALVVNSFGVIQRAILIKNIDFKTQLWIQVASNLFSGGLAILLALKGYGVWSLVCKLIAKSCVDTTLLWVLNRWRPTWEFCWKSFRQMFAFGGRILVSDVINKLYRNLYYFIIGRFFSASDLGFYSRAEQFEQLPSNILTLTLQRVTYPVLCKVTDDGDNLKLKFRLFYRNIAYIVIPLMAILAIVSKPLIEVLIGSKWLPSVQYLRLLCIAGMVVPLSYLNINLLKVKGRTDILLKLEIVKKLLAVPIVIVSMRFGITGLIYGLILASIIEFSLNSYFSGRLIRYHILTQVTDAMPFVFGAVCISLVVYVSGLILPANIYIQLIVKTSLGLIMMAGWGKMLKMQAVDISIHFLQRIALSAKGMFK
ncbi:MAG: flippase [Candidatus Cloacimonetes bacterium HGW-Cloacimonetes-2]|nr:MAG: flippase [Candidatus Cloacimonetes bacterium HGW-Cloacimonetes-2]